MCICRQYPILKSSFDKQDTNTTSLEDNFKISANVYLVDNDDQIKSKATELITKPFNIFQGPLIRCDLITCSHPTKNLLILTIHHLVLDGTQIDLICDALCSHYQNDLSVTQSNQLLYNDYTDFEQARTKQANAKFWSHYLSNSPETCTLQQYDTSQSPAAQMTRTKSLTVNTALYQQLKDFCKAQCCSFFTLMKLIYTAVLASTNQQKKWICIYPISLRSSKYRNLVGSFINVLPYILDLESTPIEAINVEKSRFNELKQNKYCPPSDIITQLLMDDIDVDIESIFQTVIADANCRVQPLILDPSTPAKNWHTPNLGPAKLLMEYQEINRQLFFNLNYPSPAFSEEAINLIAANFIHFAKEVIQQPKQKMHHIKLINSLPKEAELLTLNQLAFYQQR